ncbi:hypothetical protein E4H12_12185 [Candidatus Thorarchaeota archaeon]|nr:MAG: hypothetical protein E4H12_12185 [Candidatus Thorarchaeota archaeon]
MRIKAVLRDSEILKLEAGSKERILAAAKKNSDRIISLLSLLKVMGLTFDQRTTMLDVIKNTKLHIWLLNDAQQHLIYISESNKQEVDGYNWQ